MKNFRIETKTARRATLRVSHGESFEIVVRGKVGGKSVPLLKLSGQSSLHGRLRVTVAPFNAIAMVASDASEDAWETIPPTQEKE